MSSIWIKQLLQLTPKTVFYQQRFGAHSYVVERRFPARLVKAGRFPSLRRKHFVYDVVQPAEEVPTEMSVLLTEYVENVGQPGEVVQIREKDGRFLMLSKKAVYPTPENLQLYGGERQVQTYSSRYVKNTMDLLSKMVISVCMSKENTWTLEPWHVRVTFRKAHVIVPDDAITLPSNVIKGPDMSIEGKEFYTTVTINKTEQVIVRCRIHHWTTKIEDRIPWEPFYFKKPVDPIFPEDKAIAAQLPEIEPLTLDEDQLDAFMAKLKAKMVANAKLK